MQNTTTQLAAVPPRARVRVLRVDGDDALARRLHDLGFWPGALIEAVRVAPLGDPIVYRLHGYRLALRRDEAARVIVAATPNAMPSLHPTRAASA